MSANRHPAVRLLRVFARGMRSPALALLLSVALAGCRHKVPSYTIPTAAQVPVEPVDAPSNQPAPVIATQPPPDFGPVPPLHPPAPPPRRRSGPKEEPASPAPPAAETAPAPAELAIGSLSTGLEDAAPQIQQQARDIISSIQKRIAALSPRIADSQKREVRQVRHFLDQAQQALNTGDTVGAKNPATKASLLMDDLEKK